MEKSNNRLNSLDALRGFDMFLLIGGAFVIEAFSHIWPNPVTQWLAAQMNHAQWNGFTIMDMVFPLFLFIAGISFPFSLAKSRSLGRSDKQIFCKIIKRMLILIGLGLIYNGFFNLQLCSLRLPSVLARIGIAWAVAAWMYMRIGKKIRLAIALALLLGYWILLALVAAPDAQGAAALSLEGNIVGYVDRIIMPNHLYLKGFDPEGLLSNIPAVVTAMLGVFVGEAVQAADTKQKMLRTTGLIAAAGLALLAIGRVWGLVLPINKQLWTSSYVCFVGGISMLLFALFYYIIDVNQKQKWSFFFRVIGLNSITIYMLDIIVDLSALASFFGGGLTNMVPESCQSLVASLFYLAVNWFILYFLYKKKIFLKV